MSSYYGNNDWEECDDYEPHPRSSRPPNPNRSNRAVSDSEEDDLRNAQGARPARPSGASHFRNTDPNAYGGGHPPSRSSRPSQSSQVRYDAYDHRGPTHDQPAWSDDEYEESRYLPPRPQRNQHPGRSSQSTRSPQPSRASQPSRRRAPGPDYIFDPCPNGIHTGLEHHCLDNNSGISYWESRRHAEIAAQCGVQCEGMPYENRRISCVRPGLWELAFCRGGGCGRGQRDGDPRHGGRRGGDSRGGGRQSGGAGEVWYS